jgi:glutamate---cysteine ligase / carboxylate-amine ligase
LKDAWDGQKPHVPVLSDPTSGETVIKDRREPAAPLTAEAIRATFDATPAGTVGLEEEVMLLDPDTYELSPCAPAVMERLAGDARFKLELPASQLEIVSTPTASPADLRTQLIRAREVLSGASRGIAAPACAGVHPLSPGRGELNSGPRYERIVSEYAAVASRQLVCGLQVHVAPGAADRALAIYNAARSYLPLVAALAANAPFYEGRDTGLASVRPKLCDLLPRQGVPPAFASWDEYAQALNWGATSGAFPDPRAWWWELRPHPAYGTLEFRVPDAQRTVDEAIAVAAVVQALVQWLGARVDRGDQLRSAAIWRIEENRWSACRRGVQGVMADPQTGDPRPTQAVLTQLLDALEPVADHLGSGAYLSTARQMAQRNGALQQRRQAEEAGLVALPRWLAAGFLDG